MRQLRCPNCGANDFYYKDGFQICSYCDTKYVPDSKEVPQKSSEISLQSDIDRLLQKCKDEPFNARKYAGRILDIDPTNKEALKYL